MTPFKHHTCQLLPSQSYLKKDGTRSAPTHSAMLVPHLGIYLYLNINYLLARHLTQV